MVVVKSLTSGNGPETALQSAGCVLPPVCCSLQTSALSSLEAGTSFLPYTKAMALQRDVEICIN